MSTAQLRRDLRQKRRALTRYQQKNHAQCAAKLFLRHFHLASGKKIALFLAQDGELTTEYLIQPLRKAGHQLFLPILQTGTREMRFARWHANTNLRPNRFGIPEPTSLTSQQLSALQLDIILMPLVGFDEKGHRLGMGGGFYDFSLRHKKQNHFAKPLLIGWAHECQQAEPLQSNPWDIPMQSLVTEKRIRRFRPNPL
jgi:5-formyltetrahydrofolate cyclo-ligase